MREDKLLESNPLRPFLDDQDVVILDGGLATQLEARGCDLSDELWSARLLLDDPETIRQVHRDYLWAGADVIISASYQATVPGFMARGLSAAQAAALIQFSVRLAVEERDAFWAQMARRGGRLRPLVAASVGPYAAYKADGSEYTGLYDLDEEGLLEFHRTRWHILAGTDADLLACETIPNMAEARALARLMPETPQRAAWVSFACRDGAHIVDGTSLAEAAELLASLPQVVAIGVNCTPPRFIPSLIDVLREVSDKPIVVYPNSGETYDTVHKCWLGESVPSEFGTFGREWRKQGAALIGGCCRTTPAHIRQISDRFRKARARGEGA